MGVCCEEVSEAMKLPKIPSHIKIKNKVVYEIVWVDSFKDEDVLGECRPEQRQIALKNGMSEKQTWATFLHEILHCFQFERDVSISHKHIYELEEAIYYALFHNKW
jgi:hypothetical protein